MPMDLDGAEYSDLSRSVLDYDNLLCVSINLELLILVHYNDVFVISINNFCYTYNIV